MATHPMGWVYRQLFHPAIWEYLLSYRLFVVRSLDTACGRTDVEMQQLTTHTCGDYPLISRLIRGTGRGEERRGGRERERGLASRNICCLSLFSQTVGLRASILAGVGRGPGRVGRG